MGQQRQAVHTAPGVRRGAYGRRGALPGRGEVPEPEQRLRHLYVDEAGLDVARLLRLSVRADALGLGLGPVDALQRAAGVAEACIGLGLHRVQVGGQGGGDVRARGPQGGLGEGDGPAVVGEEQRLVDQQGDHIAAEPPVTARLRQAQGLVEVALGEAVGVGVVRADAGDGDQAADRPVQAAPHGVVVPGAQQGGGLGVEELDDPGSGRDTSGLPVHLLVVGAGGPQHLYVRRAHPAGARAGDVGVLRRVLPLPDGHHGRRTGGDGRGGEPGAPLVVGAPQGGGVLDEPRQAGGPHLGVRPGGAHADVVEGDGPFQPYGQHLADQVRDLATGTLALEPAGDRRVFVPQGQAAGPAGQIDVTGEPGTGHTRLVDQGFEQDIGLHCPPMCASGRA